MFFRTVFSLASCDFWWKMCRAGVVQIGPFSCFLAAAALAPLSWSLFVRLGALWVPFGSYLVSSRHPFGSFQVTFHMLSAIFFGIGAVAMWLPYRIAVPLSLTTTCPGLIYTPHFLFMDFSVLETLKGKMFDGLWDPIQAIFSMFLSPFSLCLRPVTAWTQCPIIWIHPQRCWLQPFPSWLIRVSRESLSRPAYAGHQILVNI